MNLPHLTGMDPAVAALAHALADAVPPRTIVTDRDTIAPWEVDWRRRWHGRADLMLEPATVAEVQAIVRAAARLRVPLVPQGGNTSMVGGATPPADARAAILSLRRLNRIRTLDAAAGLVTAEAGVILADLHAAADAAGARFPLSLGAKGSATIGGLVSTNAGGTQVLRHGTMRALTVGVEAVLPSGELFDGLSALRKDNRGYDLTQLLLAAEGTLGVVTAATLRLSPAILDRATAWVGVRDPAAALALLRRIDGPAIEGFELMPAESIATVVAHVPGTRAPLGGNHAWQVLVEAVRHNAEGEPPEALLARLLADAGDLIDDAVVSASDAQAAAMWRIRESISDAERATGPAAQHDISVPVEAMPRFMVEAAAACEARFPGTRASGFGHLGDGNVHFHVRAPAGTDPARWYADDVPVVSAFVHDLVVAAGGSISAEHGIGLMKRDELARLSAPARIESLRAIRRALDPAGIMNPGKLVTLAPAGESQ